MKRNIINKLCLSLILTLFCAPIFAQGVTIYKKDGTKIYYPYEEVDSIVTFNKDIPTGAVDLGLPSGTLWADRNIGADSPEGYGDYFAWGETSPKGEYNWSTYKWCNDTYNTLTKYCTKSDYGTVDNKTVLEPGDDAATANWGDAWRMPTLEEYKELNKKCTWIWTTQNGTKGYKVTGPNGNSIFIPARSSLVQDESDDGCTSYFEWYGYYWSASLNESYPYYAWYMYFGSDTHDSSNSSSRFYGRSVRAVAR